MSKSSLILVPHPPGGTWEDLLSNLPCRWVGSYTWVLAIEILTSRHVTVATQINHYSEPDSVGYAHPHS